MKEMKIERLKIELKKAKEDLEQVSFFVNWLESKIKLEEINQLIEEDLEEKEE